MADKIAGKTVSIGVVDTDRYGRTVGVTYVECQNINVAMVRDGHAGWYRKYARYDRQLQDAEAQANSADLGLWQDPDPIPLGVAQAQIAAGRQWLTNRPRYTSSSALRTNCRNRR